MPTFEIRDQIAENMRFYGDMRFKQLTLLLAWLAIVVAGISQIGTKDIISGIQLRLLLAIASMLVTAVLWIMEIRSTLYWAAHREAFPILWPSPPKVFMKLLNATNAVLLLYVAIYAFWLYCTYSWGESIVTKVIGTLVGVTILIFSVINYGLSLPSRHKKNQL